MFAGGILMRTSTRSRRRDDNNERDIVVVYDKAGVKEPQVAMKAPNNCSFRQQQQPAQQQQPICEAFIMTGDTILKTYTSKSENGCNKKTLVAVPTVIASIAQQPSAATATTTTTTATAAITTTATTNIATSQKSNNNIINNNNNNNNIDASETNLYVKHAHYPRAALLAEQRAKSVSLNKLSDNQYCTGQANGAGAAGFVDPLLRRRPTTRAGHDTNRDARDGDEHEEAAAEERAKMEQDEEVDRSARGRLCVISHERNRPELLPQPRPRSRHQQQRQQQMLVHEYANGDRQNSEENKQTHADQFEQESKKKIDCEYLISGQADASKTTQQPHMDPQQQQQQPQQYQQQFQHHHQNNQYPTPKVRASTLNATSMRQMKQDLSKLNGGQRLDDGDFSIEFKTGFLSRKRIFEAKGKPTSKGQRGWSRVFVILRDLRFIIRYGQQEHELEQDNQNDAKQVGEPTAKTKKKLAAKDLKNAIRLHHAFARRSNSYTKREYVFHLQLADLSELLLQANSEEEMKSWIDTINFASACLSSPPLPIAIQNSRRYYQSSTRSRPILPASYTKLSYWEQLTDHEERLERLKAELEEHLNEAPSKRNADKRSKSEFIDKIAYLKEKIEHYTVYLDLMQKKSNSHEAIILSKHPQIASLTPSKEMVRSLPIYSKDHEHEDKKEI